MAATELMYCCGKPIENSQPLAMQTVVRAEVEDTLETFAMNKLSNDYILSEMKRSSIIPVFYHTDVDVAKAVVESCYNGGLRVFEFTNRGDNALEVFTQLVKYAKKMPGLALGIGTIMDAATTEKFIVAGAHFIESPIMNTEIAEACRSHNKLWIPGCGTLTEIVAARQAGAELIKIFPGSLLGPKFVSAVLSVVPDLKLMSTGGVEPTVENLRAWFNAGVYCVGIGSKLITNAIIENKNWDELQAKVKQVHSLFWSR